MIFIGILDFNSFEGDNYLTRHLILNRETLKQELPDLEFNFIELRKFNKTEDELAGIVEKWIYFIKNAGNLTMIPKNAENIPELKEAYTQAAMNSWSQEELEIYEYWQIRDAADRYKIQEEYEKGIEAGIKKGKIEGVIEGKLEVVRNLKTAGVATDVIMQATGLSRDEIEAVET